MTKKRASMRTFYATAIALTLAVVSLFRYWDYSEHQRIAPSEDAAAQILLDAMPKRVMEDAAPNAQE